MIWKTLLSPFFFPWKWQSSETVQLVSWVSSLFVIVSNILLAFFKMLFYLTNIFYTYGVSLNIQKWGYVLFNCLPFFSKWYNFQPIDNVMYSADHSGNRLIEQVH